MSDMYTDKPVVSTGVHHATIRGNPVAKYMMAAYAYYVEDDPIMSDWEFDSLAQQLLESYDRWTLHPHLPSKDDLRAGTYLGDYPEIVKIALNCYRRTFHS